MYRIAAASEQVRPPRLVRVAVVQNGIVRPTTDPVKEQVNRTAPGSIDSLEDVVHVIIFMFIHALDDIVLMYM